MQMRSGVGAPQPPSYITLTNRVTAYEGPKAALAAMRVSDAVPKASSSAMTPNSTATLNDAATAATKNSAPSDKGALLPGTEPVNSTMTVSDGTIAADSTSAVITTAAPMSVAAPDNTMAAINDAAADATANGLATNGTSTDNNMAPLTAAVPIDGTSGTASLGGAIPAMSATFASDPPQNTLTTNAQLQVLPPVADGTTPSAASANVPTIITTTTNNNNNNDTVTVPTPPIAMPIVTLRLKTPVAMQEAPEPGDSALAAPGVASSQQPLATNGIANVSTRPVVASSVTTTKAVGASVTAPRPAASLGVFRATDPGLQRRVSGGT
ncbi:hypothetical protein Vafri_5787 [Volvox africanus]|nr:hypothetical protein Vafri_5787 [Volvox africanus]